MNCALELHTQKEYLSIIHGIGFDKTGRRWKRVTPGKDRRSQADEPREEGGPDEAATFIAETVTDLARLAAHHKLDVLGHLLGMARLEAEEYLRLRSKRKLS